MSTSPVRTYVSYLLTDELVRAIERIDKRLSTIRGRELTDQEQLEERVRADLWDELVRRQQVFPGF